MCQRVGHFPKDSRCLRTASLPFMAAIFLFSDTSLARMRVLEDADYRLEFCHTEIDVAPDGSSTMIVEKELSARTDKGRRQLASQTLPYLPGLMELKVLSAETTTGVGSVRVPLETASDRQLNQASGWHGLILPFSSVNIGSRIHYSYLTRVKHPLLNGVFSKSFHFGSEMPEVSGHIVIKSPRPLNYAVVDPESHLEVRTHFNSGVYTLTIDLKKPAYNQIVDEPSAYYRSGSRPSVDVSTAPSWGYVAKSLATAFETQISQPLPHVFQEIVTAATNESTPEAKIERVIGELHQRLIFEDVWIYSKRLFQPRGHEMVAALKNADSKDFAVSAAAILRKLGFDVAVSLVNRGSAFDRELRQPTTSIAVIERFNRAILRWTKENGTVHWIDPSSPINYSSGVPSSLAGALVLPITPRTTSLAQIPEDGIKADLAISTIIRSHLDGTADFTGRMSATGAISSALRETGFNDGKAALNLQLWGLLTSEKTAPQTDFQYDLHARTGEALEVPVHMISHAPITTEKDIDFISMSFPDRISALGLLGADRSSDVYLGPPGETTRFTRLTGYDVEDETNENCYVLGDYFDVIRDVARVNGGLEIRDTVRQKKSLLPAALGNQRLTLTESERVNFKNFSLRLAQCTSATRIELISKNKYSLPKSDREASSGNAFDDLGPAHLDQASFEDASKLAGQDSLTRRDYRLQKARRIFSRLLENDAPDLRPRDLAGLAMTILKIGNISEDQFEDAYQQEALRIADLSVKALKEVATIRPEVQPGFVYRSRSLIYLRAKRLQEASDDFKLAVHFEPKANANFVLGAQIAEAGGNREKAERWYFAFVNATEPTHKAAAFDTLGNFYLNAKNYSRAESAYKKSLQLDPKSAWTWHNLAIAQTAINKDDDAIKSERAAIDITQFGEATHTLSDILTKKAAQMMQKATNHQEQASIEDMNLEALKWNADNVAALRNTVLFYMGTPLANEAKNKSGNLWRALEYANRLAKVDATQRGLQQQIKKMLAGHDEDSDRSPASERSKWFTWPWAANSP